MSDRLLSLFEKMASGFNKLLTTEVTNSSVFLFASQ